MAEVLIFLVVFGALVIAAFIANAADYGRALARLQEDVAYWKERYQAMSDAVSTAGKVAWVAEPRRLTDEEVQRLRWQCEPGTPQELLNSGVMRRLLQDHDALITELAQCNER